MIGSARLQALRLQGFKSFAERTLVEFGPGISAVVGPNGSGKSNLADALRWALGEQGRSLRIRRSEDVIFAGSERRSALGMADVTLVIDNADGLLPVEFTAVELGRRLYRSGENDYLLNRQRVRLRDLVELLDAANLADNAFLFIGQGMVDQALALRPEERRPLFEEVAGVRRHERRRRRGEAQLDEAEQNLARVEDIVAELRPQARRLAAQAEQQATRADAGAELADALVLLGHARWRDATGRARTARHAREAAERQAARARREVAEAEAEASAATADLGARARIEAERRDRHEATRAALTGLQLREARLAAELASVSRDRERTVGERQAAEESVAGARRAMAAPVPPRDVEAEAELAAVERDLAEAQAELAALHATRQAEGERLAALRRAEARRQADLDTARRRATEAGRRSAEEGVDLETALGAAAEREAAVEAARARLAEAIAAATTAEERRETARAHVDEAESARGAAVEDNVRAAEALAAAEARAADLRARLEDDDAGAIAVAARRLGGRRLDEGIQVDDRLRAAVDAALGDAGRAYVVPAGGLGALGGERGTVVVGDGTRTTEAPGDPSERLVVERAVELGGGPLTEAILRDGPGTLRRLLEHAVWVPDREAAFALRPRLPPGWIAVVADGSAVVASLVATLGRPEPSLERRSELERLTVRIEALRATVAAARDAVAEAEHRSVAARTALADARAAEADAARVRMAAEEAERVAARQHEVAVREVAWHRAQWDRLLAEAARGSEALERLEAESVPGLGGTDAAVDEATAAWERRVDESRGRRDRVAAVVADRDARRRAAEAGVARAETTVALGEERAARAARELERLATAEAAALAELEAVAEELAIVAGRESEARRAVEELRAADAADRERLADAEARVAARRDAALAAEDRVRVADVGEVEARLALDQIRENLLVELAGLGEAGLTALEREAAQEVAGDGDEASRLEALVGAAADRWEASDPPVDPPSNARLGVLRRRFHELGAPNPFAVEEYAAVRERLEMLEEQQRDLRAAIATTRRLIDELDTLIADQFRATFRALETAFDRRFRQLFGGGFARLTLTEPNDLSTTGVEIVARPPGKRAQPLAMLSGGERALTAVALLFAMLEVRPVPFCVLDEVDAALDEANVGRFTEALRELARATQCIVITHNRGTIEAADALYGVTVGDDSVSRVVSLRLEEAQAIADRAREADAAEVAVP